METARIFAQECARFIGAVAVIVAIAAIAAMIVVARHPPSGGFLATTPTLRGKDDETMAI